MKSLKGQKPVVVILGNADNTGELVARVFAAQGAVVAMLSTGRADGDRMMGCLQGSNHLHVAGNLNDSVELASFAELISSLYGHVDHLICCEDAGVMLSHGQSFAWEYMAQLLECIFVSGASVVSMASRSRKFASRQSRQEKNPLVLADFLSRRDIRMNRIILHRSLIRWSGAEPVASAACAAALFLCSGEAAHLQREYIVVNGKKAIFRFRSRPCLPSSFLKQYLDVCMACTRSVWSYA